jgi:hypothetical protein
MSSRITWRERSTWLAVSVGLVVSSAWITTLGAVVVLRSHVHLTQALALARILARVALALAPHLWPVLPLALLGGMMIALAVRSAAPARRKVRHA